MNLGELRTAVRLRAAVPTTDAKWTDAYVEDAINEANYLIGTEQPWPWLEDVETITGPSDPIDLAAITPAVRDIRSVTVDDAYQATYITVGEMDRWGNHGRYSTYSFTTWGDDLVIKPAPSSTSTVKIRYYRNEPTLTDDTDTPLLPAAYHPAIVHMAAAIGFEGLDDPSSAGVHEARARIIVNRLARVELSKVRGPRSVRVRSGLMN